MKKIDVNTYTVDCVEELLKEDWLPPFDPCLMWKIHGIVHESYKACISCFELLFDKVEG